MAEKIETYALSIDDIIDVRLSLEDDSLSKPNPNRIAIITDETNKSKNIITRGTNASMILEEFGSFSKVAIVVNSIFGQPTGVKDGGGDVIVISTAYMERDKAVVEWSLPFPSAKILASIDEFSIAWKIDGQEPVEFSLPVDVDKWTKETDTNKREAMFLEALQKLFRNDFKVFKKENILVFQKLDNSIVSSLEFVHPKGLGVANLKELLQTLKNITDSDFYKNIQEINLKNYKFKLFDNYKTMLGLIPNEIEKLKAQKKLAEQYTKDKSILKSWDDTIAVFEKSKIKIQEVIDQINNNITNANELSDGIIDFKNNDFFVEYENKIKTISDSNKSEIKTIENYLKATLEDFYTILNYILPLYECAKVDDYKLIPKDCSFQLSSKYTPVIEMFVKVITYLDDIKKAYEKLDEDLAFIENYKKDIDFVIAQSEWAIIYHNTSLVNKLSYNTAELSGEAAEILDYEMSKEDMKTKFFDIWKSEIKAIYTIRKPVNEQIDLFASEYLEKLASRFPKLSAYDAYVRRVKGLSEALPFVLAQPIIYNKVIEVMVATSKDTKLNNQAKSILDKEYTKEQITAFFISILSFLQGKPDTAEEIKRDATNIATNVYTKFYRSAAFDWILKIADIVKEGECDIEKLRKLLKAVPAKCSKTSKELADKLADRDETLKDFVVKEWCQDMINCIDDGKSTSEIINKWIERVYALLWDGWIKEQICINPIKVKKERRTKWLETLKKANLSAKIPNSKEIMLQALTFYLPPSVITPELSKGANQIALKQYQIEKVQQWFLKACPLANIYTEDNYDTEARDYTKAISNYHAPSDVEKARQRYNNWYIKLQQAVADPDNKDAKVKAVFLEWEDLIAENQQNEYKGYINGLIEKKWTSEYFSNAFKSFMLQFGLDWTDDEINSAMNGINELIKDYYTKKNN